MGYNNTQVLRILRSPGIHNLVFVKRDGSERKMRCRTDKEYEATGNPSSYSPEERGQITVWDVGRKGWRNVDLNTIIEIDGKHIRSVKTADKHVENVVS